MKRSIEDKLRDLVMANKELGDILSSRHEPCSKTLTKLLQSIREELVQQIISTTEESFEKTDKTNKQKNEEQHKV